MLPNFLVYCFWTAQGNPLGPCLTLLNLCLNQVACVSLVHTTSILTHEGHFLRAQVDGECCPGEQFIYEPQRESLELLRLSGVDSLVTVHEEGTILIPVQNFRGGKVIVPKGVKLGRVEPYDESKVSVNQPPDIVPHGSACSKVVVDRPGYHEPELPPRLLKQLDLSMCDCNPQQLTDLKDLRSKHADVFASDPSEIGCCGRVQHIIDTGDTPPLKQQPYRTPVVKREKLAQLINEMQEQVIVRPSLSSRASPVVMVSKTTGPHVSMLTTDA